MNKKASFSTDAIIGMLTLFLLLACCAKCQTIPTEVKQATVAALKASDTDGMHEEGFIWGKDAVGNVLIVVSAVVPCQAKICVTTFDAANPEVAARLTSIDGFAHVHPKGDGKHAWVQPPSREDLNFAALSPGTIYIVIGSASKVVYFYDSHGMTSTVKLKEFLQ